MDTEPQEPRVTHAHERLGWNDYFLEIARAVSLRADCSRRQVGAVVVDSSRRIVSTGYNGAEPGGPSCLKGECPRGLRSTGEVAPGTSYDTGEGACIAIHAEQNAIVRASWDEMEAGFLYVTCEPCGGCWRFIKATPLLAVVWPDGVWFREHINRPAEQF